jgi:hypothetical protein
VAGRQKGGDGRKGGRVWMIIMQEGDSLASLRGQLRLLYFLYEYKEIPLPSPPETSTTIYQQPSHDGCWLTGCYMDVLIFPAISLLIM